MFSQICSSQKDIDDLLTKLKISPCPHCKTVGALIKHGFLRGYDHNNQLNKSIRAARVYCSNRYRAAGCGRTFSVWTADKIKHFFLSAHSLWQFLNEAATSGSKLGAFRKLACGLNESATYHVWRRFLNALAAIRTALCPLCEPPRIDEDCPAIHTLKHLHLAFKEHTLSPIAAFQATFKTFFF